MWRTSGQGGIFFEDIYDWFDIEDFRDYPSKKEEFLKAGLTESVYDEYIDYVSRLYGDYFIRNNTLAGMNDKILSKRMNLLWKEFIDFCITNNLILEFVNDENTRMYINLPSELDSFQFIYQFPVCANMVHICTVDEFRWCLELVLGEKRDDWYLKLKYGVNVKTDINGSSLVKYDIKSGEYIFLTDQEANQIYEMIGSDVKEIESDISVLEKNPPDKIVYDQPIIGRKYIEILHEQENWIKKRYALERKLELVSTCEYMICDCFEELYDEDNEADIFDDDTLYVHKGTIVCKKNNHCTENATAILMNTSGKDIELNVSYCCECKKFFISYSTYRHYREKYGPILGNIKMTQNGEYVWDSLDLADESSLHLCGYNVSQKDNLSDIQRRTIITATIESGAMTKDDIIHLLNYFIDVNGAKKGNEIARSKWCSDLDFVLAYNTEKQKHFVVSKIVPYRRNRFVIDRSKSTAKNHNINAEHLINKRVQHIRYGLGVIIRTIDSSITIRFDNGKEAKFSTDVFDRGIVRFIV